jgi:hypothetical protein
MPNKPFLLEAVPVCQGCRGCTATASVPSFAQKVCYFPLYRVTQAILDLANPLGSTDAEVLAQSPAVCAATVLTLAQVQAALAEGARKRILLLNATTGRYCVNAAMNQFAENEAIYRDFRDQIWCVGLCTPCSTCQPFPPCALDALVPDPQKCP